MKRKKKLQNVQADKETTSVLSSNRVLFVALLAATLCVGLYWRFAGLASRGLEYDEFWTLTHYVPLSVSSILSALATPNNHPLNSLLMKASVLLFGPSPLSMRLPAFLAGALLLIPAGFAVWIATRRKTAVLITLALLSTNGAFIHFGQTARGYSLQLLLLTFLLYLIVLHVKSDKDSFQLCGGIFATSGFAIFALPTSILYIVPLAILHLAALLANTVEKLKTRTENKLTTNSLADTTHATVVNSASLEKRICAEPAQGTQQYEAPLSYTVNVFIKQNGMMFAAYIALAIAAAFWYGDNYSAFRAGQGQFSHLASFQDWVFFVGNTCGRITSPLIWLLATLPLFFPKWRWVAISAIFAVAFPFLLVPLTKAGPVRTYIPIFIFTAISAGIGVSLLVDKLREKPKLRYLSIFLILAALYVNGESEKKSWTPTDWRVVVNEMRKEFGPGNCLIYPPNPCYAILANFGPEAVIENYARLPRRDNDTLVLVGMGSTLRGLDANHQPGGIKIDEKFLAATKSIAGIKCALFDLQRIRYSEEAVNSTCPLFISIHGWNYAESKAIRNEVMEIMRSEGIITCDAWLSRKWRDQNGVEHIGYLFVCDESTSKASKQYLLNRFRSNPAISFHVLRAE